MLPDPKDVAKGIRHIFQSKEEKQRAVELERDVQLRRAKSHIRGHIAKQKEMTQRLRSLAKRALVMGDEGRFRQAAKQLVWTEKDVARWEKYTLTLELMEARREQVKASSDLVSAVKMMTDSMAELADAEGVGQLQQEVDRSLAKAASMDERIRIMMDMVDSTLGEGIPMDETSVEKLRESLGEEVIAQEESPYDREMEADLEKIRKDLLAEKEEDSKT